jgi:hypothetical protein
VRWIYDGTAVGIAIRAYGTPVILKPFASAAQQVEKRMPRLIVALVGQHALEFYDLAYGAERQVLRCLVQQVNQLAGFAF